eukprot:1403041-Rhodomonas_salina.2
MDYEGRGAMCADFMQHPRTREAQLQKCEVVALRLYTGCSTFAWCCCVMAMAVRVCVESSTNGDDAR